MGAHSESSSDSEDKNEDDKDNDLDGMEATHMEEEKQDEAAVVSTWPTLKVTPPFDETVAPYPEPNEKTGGMENEEERQTEGHVDVAHECMISLLEQLPLSNKMA